MGWNSCRMQIPKDHVTPLPAPPVEFSHIHLGNATPQRRRDPLRWLESHRIRLLCRACWHLPSRRASKQLLSHSKTMKAKPQSPKVPLSHSSAAATAPQPSQNSPPPAAADPHSKGAGKRFPAEKASLSGHRHGWRS